MTKLLTLRKTIWKIAIPRRGLNLGTYFSPISTLATPGWVGRVVDGLGVKAPFQGIIFGWVTFFTPSKQILRLRLKIEL